MRQYVVIVHNNWSYLTTAAILITGGYDAYQSAEVFLPATATSCLVSARLVQERQDHSQDGLLLCGGSEALTTCEEFSPATGTWALTNHTLQDRASNEPWRSFNLYNHGEGAFPG